MSTKKNKIALVIRYGAFGDMVIITPVLRRLKELGYHVILEASSRGIHVIKDNPNVDELYEYEDEKVPNDQLENYWSQFRDYIKPDKYINFCESIEVALAIHPNKPEYKTITREEKLERCDKNYYEFSMDWAGLKSNNYIPELFFSKEEHDAAKSFIKRDKFNILIGLMGSGMNKMWPWTVHLVKQLVQKYKDVNIITVGDTRCLHIEREMPDQVIKLSARVNIRQSLAFAKHVDLVIAPDTGLLHASGCYDTPKIGLLGHTTKENITKHFVNDYSIEAQCDCAPCFNLVYEYKDQCPIDFQTKAAMCMGKGITLDQVLFTIDMVKNKHYRRN